MGQYLVPNNYLFYLIITLKLLYPIIETYGYDIIVGNKTAGNPTSDLEMEVENSHFKGYLSGLILIDYIDSDDVLELYLN